MGLRTPVQSAMKLGQPGRAGVLEHALVVEGSAELHVAALQAVLGLAVQHPAAVRQRYRSRLPWLQGFLGHVDSAGAGPLFQFCLLLSAQGHFQASRGNLLAVKPCKIEHVLVTIHPRRVLDHLLWSLLSIVYLHAVDTGQLLLA